MRQKLLETKLCCYFLRNWRRGASWSCSRSSRPCGMGSRGYKRLGPRLHSTTQGLPSPLPRHSVASPVMWGSHRPLRTWEAPRGQSQNRVGTGVLSGRCSRTPTGSGGQTAERCSCLTCSVPPVSAGSLRQLLDLLHYRGPGVSRGHQEWQDAVFGKTSAQAGVLHFLGGSGQSGTTSNCALTPRMTGSGPAESSHPQPCLGREENTEQGLAGEEVRALG